jgi:chromosome segregation ATPase
VQKLDVIIARLRLLLADVTTKQGQVSGLRRQLREQMNRIVSYSLYGDADLERTLGLMGDVEQRLRDAEMQEQHLGLIRDRVERELESLLLTRGVEQAKSRLGELQQRKAEIERALGGSDATAEDASAPAAELAQAEQVLADEIRQLQHEINEASERAARSIESQPSNLRR